MIIKKKKAHLQKSKKYNQHEPYDISETWIKREHKEQSDNKRF